MHLRRYLLPILASSFFCAWPLHSQDLAEFLKERVIPKELPMQQVQEFCKIRIPALKSYATPQEWEQEAKQLRKDALEKVVLRGEAANWNKLPTKVEWLDPIDGGPEYRIRKFRYEAVPGLWVPGLLYEPKAMTGKVPVIMNVNGHDSEGTAAKYKQIRCINQAKRGMLAMNLEWIGMGQLGGAEYDHYKMNQLDLVGTSGVSPFYFGLKRGLDILLEHQNADTNRVAVTGLSGGAWQTIFISGLDERVTLANPVAGYSSFFTRAEHLMDLGDSEQTPSDLATVVDYLHLTAMRAPRPTLLTYNAKDACCFRADHALEPLLKGVQPFYDLYGKGDQLRSHINHDPGTHNYEKDNRQQFYKMVGDFFYGGDPNYSAEEISAEAEVKTKDQLMVPLPQHNATFNSLAKGLLAKVNRAKGTASERRKLLGEIVKWHDLKVKGVKRKEMELGDIRGIQYAVEIGESWTVPGYAFIPQNAREAVLLVSDEGRHSLIEEIKKVTGEGKVAAVIDPFYFGESKIASHDFLFALLVATVGERPLGIQASQITAVAKALKEAGITKVSLYARGPRLGLAARVATALAPTIISDCRVESELTSLNEVLEKNWSVNLRPEMFCFGLLKAFELDEIQQMGKQAQ